MTKSKYIRYWVTLTICLITNSSYALLPADTKYNIICGIAQPSTNTFKIIKVGTNIPFVTKKQDPDFYFGCTVKINNISILPDNNFTLHAQLTLPTSNLAAYESNIGYSKKHLNDTLVIKTDPVTFTKIGSVNTGYVVFTFDDNDPIGNYLVDIYVNDIVEKHVVFSVVKQSYNKANQHGSK